MSKGGSSTVTQQLDPQTQAYVNQMRRAALGYAGIPGSVGPSSGGMGNWIGQFQASHGAQPFAPNYPPELLAAQQQYGQYANAGQQGLTALTGGANPFMNQYLSQMNPTFDFLREQAVSDADARATQMGAFGGSRGDIFAATARGDIDRAQAGLNYSAFNDSQQRALALAGLGFGAAGMQAFLPQQWAQGQLGLLNMGLGPYGTSQTQQTSSDPFSQLLGFGLTAASFFPGPHQPFVAGANAADLLEY